MDDTKVYPFEVKWPDQVLDDLKSRLKGARIGHEQLQDVPNFEYGFNLATLQKWRHYWLNEYNWRKNEAILNGFPHFITELEGLKVLLLFLGYKFRKNGL
jgi:hypothetical protein